MRKCTSLVTQTLPGVKQSPSQPFFEMSRNAPSQSVRGIPKKMAAKDTGSKDTAVKNSSGYEVYLLHGWVDKIL